MNRYEKCDFSRKKPSCYYYDSKIINIITILISIMLTNIQNIVPKSFSNIVPYVGISKELSSKKILK
jgi:hypothetical protein